MPTCHDLRQGEVYACNICGVELKVTKECCNVTPGDDCDCTDDETSCIFNCCGEDMQLKS